MFHRKHYIQTDANGKQNETSPFFIIFLKHGLQTRSMGSSDQYIIKIRVKKRGGMYAPLDLSVYST
jgi:hypothetical protein